MLLTYLTFHCRQSENTRRVQRECSSGSGRTRGDEASKGLEEETDGHVAHSGSSQIFEMGSGRDRHSHTPDLILSITHSLKFLLIQC